MCRAHPVLTASDGARVDVRAACDTVARWNGRADAGSRGEALWEMFFDESLWAVPFDPAHPLTTPNRIDADRPDVQRAFADAVRLLERNPAARSATRWDGITLPGCPAEKGCFNVIESTASLGPPPSQASPPPGPQQRRPAGKPVVFGSSFIMAVEMTPRGPRARTILTYSQSANPASPHYSDQTALFANKRWGHRAVHQGRDQRRSAPADDDPARLIRRPTCDPLGSTARGRSHAACHTRRRAGRARGEGNAIDWTLTAA
jgi:acyl-homoserine-lactone acylase